MTKELYDIGTAPPVGEVPKKMHGWLIRQDRFGKPTKAFQKEVIDVPAIKDDEVLVYVMAAGVNYNNVWAGLGVPIDVIGIRNKLGEPEEFHIGGSDASGIVYKIGKDVTNVKVGDEVVVHCGSWGKDCQAVKTGKDPMYDPTFKIWGYETNYGSFAQFTKVQDHMVLPKPKHLNWEEAASYMLVGATAYRMLMAWAPNNVKKDESWKPLTPNFCPYVDPETDKKCGKFMHRWDVMFYDDYGMCEECYLKHNPTEKIDG